MFSRKLLLFLFLSVYFTVIQCESEDQLFKLMVSNLNNHKDSVKTQEIATDNTEQNVSFPALTLFDKMPIILPIDVDDYSSVNKMPLGLDKENGMKIKQTASVESMQKTEDVDGSKLLIGLLNSLQSADHEKQQLDKLNSSFKSFTSIEDIPKNFGKLNPFDLLELSSFRNQFFNRSIDEPKANTVEFYIVQLESNDEDIMSTEKKNQQGIPLLEEDMPRNISTSEKAQSPSSHNIMDDFADTMKYMINSMHQTLSDISFDNVLHGKTYTPPNLASNLNISIYSQGETNFIPSNAYVNHNNSGLVNITWKSVMKDFNNSLSFKLSKDESGNIIVQQMDLSILEENDIHEFKLNEPVYVNNTNGIANGTVPIKLTGKAGIKFLSSQFLDVISVDMSENNSNQWLVISIAVLGLVIAGLMMIISYITYKRKQRYPRKGSLSKEAIVY